MKKINLDWFIAAGTRAAKTMAQTALGMFTVGAAVNDIQWKHVISVAVVAGVYSLLTSVATKLPEVGNDGDISISASDEKEDIYQVNVNAPLSDLKNKKSVTLKVK